MNPSQKNRRTSILGILALATPAHAANLIALLDGGAGNYLLGSFDSGNLAAQTNTPITNLSPGESLIGLDYRPATGTVYAVGSSANVYTINTTTGVATGIGSFSSPVPGTQFGFDFNPAFMSGTFARIISDLDDNRVISGVDGSYLGADKTDVFYILGDPSEGTNPIINHIAYSNSVFGATSTQQYGIDTGLDILTTVNNNAGELATIGGLGIDASSAGGFDIDGLSGIAFAGFQSQPGLSSIYTIDLATGAATLQGNILGDIIGLTAVPEPSTTLLAALDGLTMAFRRRR